MRLIDASELIQVLCVNMDTGEQFDKATHCVDVMPTVDAVPVVRCKNCKRYREYTYLGTQIVYVCERNYRKRIFDMNADDFCSRGEKR